MCVGDFVVGCSTLFLLGTLAGVWGQHRPLRAVTVRRQKAPQSAARRSVPELCVRTQHLLHCSCAAACAPCGPEGCEGLCICWAGTALVPGASLGAMPDLQPQVQAAALLLACRRRGRAEALGVHAGMLHRRQCSAAPRSLHAPREGA